MSIKDLFKKTTTVQNNSTSSFDVESSDYILAKKALNKTFIPQVDFASASNFAKYGSAKEYYTKAIERIYDFYPFDGSEKEKIFFELSSSYLEQWVFDNRYPKTTGHALLGTTGYPGSPTTVGNYGSPGTAEYIRINGGLHTASAGMIGKPLYQTFDSSIKYDAAKNRKSSLRVNMISGSTVEFWLYKTGYNASKTATEVVFDLWNGNASSSANYGRMSILLKRAGHSTGKASPFYLTVQSGTVGAFETQIGSNIGSLGSTPNVSWSHFAFSFISESSGVKARLYKNGTLNDTVTLGSAGMGEIRGTLNAHIGSLISNPSGTVYHNASSNDNLKGYGKLSASLDDFRFWKKRRTSEEIYNNWFRHVGGGTNTDDANINLGIYYKFNEGVTNRTSTDSVVLDYSGRLSQGKWTGYSSGARSTDSAFTLSGLVATEPADPIMYSFHPSVTSLLSEMQTSGSLWDEQNPTMLYHSLPNWVIEEDDKAGNDAKYLFQIISNYFDTLHAQITAVPNLKSKTYPSSSFKPVPFASNLLKEKNLIAPNIFINSKILESFGSRDANRVLYEKNLYEVKNLIYKNIYNNLIEIYKSKGTERSIRNMLRCFGIDDELVKLNLYTDGGTHLFKNNIKHSSVSKKYINFHNESYFNASVYQTTSSNNSNTFITGSGAQGLEKYCAFTAEVDVILPDKPSVYSSKYFHTPFVSSSIFGMHEPSGSQHGASPPAVGDYSWDTYETASLQVYVVREKKDSKNAKFVLENADGTIHLTSSTFHNIYDNQRWNLAVRVKPDKYPLIGNYVGSPDESHIYKIEFYGVHSSYEDTNAEFLVTASINASSGSGYLSNSRRFYIGAHLQNFTGSVLQQSDVKIGALRYYKDYLSNDIIKQHNLDPTNIGMKESYKSSTLFANGLTNVHVPSTDLLSLAWDFSTVSASSANGYYVVDDTSSGSSDTIYGWIDNIVRREHKGFGRGFGSAASDFFSNEFIFASKKELPEISFSSNTITIQGDKEKNFIEDDDVSDNFFALEKSMYQVISDDMLNIFSSVSEFNNLIGKSIDRYRMEYKNLNLLRRLYFENISGSLDLDKFTEYFKWIDVSISRTVEQLFPASARFSSGISDVIDSHILERNKYQNKFPLLTRVPSTEASIKGQGELHYNWRVGHAPVGWTETNVSGTAGTTQGDNCLWHKERNIRTDISDREAIRKVIVNDNNAPSKMLAKQDGTIYQGSTYAIRRFSKPFKMRQDLNHSIHGGTNYAANKDRDIIRNLVQIHGPKTTLGIPKNVVVVGHGPGQGIVETKKCNDVFGPPQLKKEKIIIEAHPGRFSTGTGPHFPHSLTNYTFSFKQNILPMNVLTSSVTGGYHAILERGYKSGSSFVNLHSDTISPTNEIPMQGPFTDNWVGGRQHRHVELNKYDALRIDGDTGLPTVNNLDSRYTRQEAYQIKFVDATNTDGAFGFVGADYGGPYPDQTKKTAIWYREERAKRPLNIKNIKTNTSGGTLFSLGNYKETYEVLGASGRHENNRYLTRNPNISNYLPSSIYTVLPETTNPMTLLSQAAIHDGNVFGKHNNNRQPDIKAVAAVAATGSLTFNGINHIDEGYKFAVTSSTTAQYEIGGSSAFNNIAIGSSDSEFWGNVTASLEANSAVTTATRQIPATFTAAPFIVVQPGSGQTFRNYLSGTYTTNHFNNNAFSLSSWLYVSSSLHSNSVIFSQSSSVGNGYARQIKYISSSKILKLYVNYRTSGGASKYIEWLMHPVTLTNYMDKWFHFAVTHNSSSTHHGTASADVKMYINGTEFAVLRSGDVGTLGSGFTFNTPNNKFFLMNQNSGSGVSFGGMEWRGGGMAQVGQWKSVLSAANVKSLYNCHELLTLTEFGFIDAANNVSYLPLTSSIDPGTLIPKSTDTITTFKDLRYLAQTVTASVNVQGNMRFLHSPEETKSQAFIAMTSSTKGVISGQMRTLNLPVDCPAIAAFDSLDGGVDGVVGYDNVISAPTPLINSERNKTVITSRFSAPGAIEASSIGYLDAYSREYSVYNNLNYRNLSVRSSGSGEAGTIRLDDHNGNRVGLNEHLRRHSGKFGHDSVQGSLTSNGYVTVPSIHKIHRNTSRLAPSSSTKLLAPVFNETHDNAFISRPIPQSDFQYSWITASLGGPDSNTGMITRNFLAGHGAELRDTSFSGLGSSDFTISFWFYSNDNDGEDPPTNNSFIRALDSGNARHVISPNVGTDQIAIRYKNTAQNSDQAVFSDIGLKIGEFVHIIVHFDVGDLSDGVPRLWVNGIERTGTGYSTIGGTTPNIDDIEVELYEMAGIQDLIFWNKLLTDAEIKELYNSGNYIDPSKHSAQGNIVSWFKLGYESQWAGYSPPSGSGDTLKGTITIPDSIGSNEFTLTDEDEFKLMHRHTFEQHIGDFSLTSGRQRIYGYAPRDGILSSSVVINGESGFVPAISFPSASEIYGE